jgi:hypothetical protein
MAQTSTAFEAFGTANLATDASRPIYKNLYRIYGSGPRKVFIWTFIYLGLQNLPWDFQVQALIFF